MWRGGDIHQHGRIVLHHDEVGIALHSRQPRRIRQSGFDNFLSCWFFYKGNFSGGTGLKDQVGEHAGQDDRANWGCPAGSPDFAGSAATPCQSAAKNIFQAFILIFQNFISSSRR
jgi:hypothetical protein